MFLLKKMLFCVFLLKNNASETIIFSMRKHENHEKITFFQFLTHFSTYVGHKGFILDFERFLCQKYVFLIFLQKNVEKSIKIAAVFHGF